MSPLLLYHHHHLDQHPDIPWAEFTQEWENYNPLIKLIVWREHLKQRKVQKGSWDPKLDQELKNMILTIEDLDSRIQGDSYYTEHIISHSEFMKNLKENPSQPSSGKKAPRISQSL